MQPKAAVRYAESLYVPKWHMLIDGFLIDLGMHQLSV